MAHVRHLMRRGQLRGSCWRGICLEGRLAGHFHETLLQAHNPVAGRKPGDDEDDATEIGRDRGVDRPRLIGRG